MLFSTRATRSYVFWRSSIPLIVVYNMPIYRAMSGLAAHDTPKIAHVVLQGSSLTIVLLVPALKAE